MNTPFDIVCMRLEHYGLRLIGDRGRAACPVCGGKNRSTLSVGVTREGAVLLKCFKSECDVESIATALGLQVHELFPPRDSHAPPQRRRRLLMPAQALDLLYVEANIVAVVAIDIGQGRDIPEGDRERVLSAAARITALRQEVYA